VLGWTVVSWLRPKGKDWKRIAEWKKAMVSPAILIVISEVVKPLRVTMDSGSVIALDVATAYVIIPRRITCSVLEPSFLARPACIHSKHRRDFQPIFTALRVVGRIHHF
jgi:hypothetical protein